MIPPAIGKLMVHSSGVDGHRSYGRHGLCIDNLPIKQIKHGTGWGPPVISWFITPSKYSYLRIIHQLVIVAINQLS